MIYSKQELLDPLNTHINNIKFVNNYEEIIQNFINVTQDIHLYMDSYYKDIENYFAYVYCIKHIATSKYYIGVRYTANKYNIIAYKDLIEYKSSSTNDIFINRQKTHPHEFEYIVLKEFNTDIDARNYEALCHQLYNCKNNNKFYNKSNEIFINYEIYKKEIKVYDNIGNIINITYNNRYFIMQTYNITFTDLYRSLTTLWYTIKYKLFINYDTYIKYTTIYTLYYWDTINQKVQPITKSYMEWLEFENSIKGNFRIYNLIYKNYNYSQGYYLDKNICLEDNMKRTIYTKDEYNNLITLCITKIEMGEIDKLLFKNIFNLNRTEYIGYSLNPGAAKYYYIVKFIPNIILIDDILKLKVYYRECSNGEYLNKYEVSKLLESKGENKGTGGGKTNTLFSGTNQMSYGVYTNYEKFKKEVL